MTLLELTISLAILGTLFAIVAWPANAYVLRSEGGWTWEGNMLIMGGGPKNLTINIFMMHFEAIHRPADERPRFAAVLAIMIGISLAPWPPFNFTYVCYYGARFESPHPDTRYCPLINFGGVFGGLAFYYSGSEVFFHQGEGSLTEMIIPGESGSAVLNIMDMYLGAAYYVKGEKDGNEPVKPTWGWDFGVSILSGFSFQRPR